MFPRKSLAFAACLLALALSFGGGGRPALAETSEVRIAQQFGVSYLPFIVAKEKRLVEKHAVAAGLPEPKVDWIVLSGASAQNDALISGRLDIASAGVGPMILLWDKTRGSVNIVGVTALGSMANVLTSNNPKVHALKDFTDKDRIALPSVKNGFQPIVLQMAAEKALGKYDALDHLTVSLPHPDATAALLSGGAGITAHFTSPPFVQQQLQSGKVHPVISSYDILGGSHTFNVAYAPKKFVDANPKTVAAFVAALDEANSWIAANPAEAAQVYIKAEKSSLDPNFVEAIIKDPNVNFTTTPERIQPFADFLYRSGQIKQHPASWKDVFQPGLHTKAGS